ncbi:MAG: RpiB/LacA/LacB family sugar-phosphate isomerase [Candidatus Curtissbacteria bacterium]|nr:RpiB/LacA/LacB family sugar-phosphate isomerase [Candidatus Curtissbacteria bacterium]
MRIYIASDHAGFDLKKVLIEHLKSEGKEVEDCGAFQYDEADDYPDFIYPCAQKVANDTGSLGIVIGGSGQGEAMVANKAKGARAAVFYGVVMPQGAVDITGRTSEDPLEMLRLTREHNDANVLSLGVRFLTVDQAKEAVDAWIGAKFTAEARHVRRIEKIKKFEEQ